MMDATSMAVIGGLLVAVLTVLIMVVKGRKNFGAWVLLIRRRQGPDQLEIYKASLVTIKQSPLAPGTSHPFLKIQSKNIKDLLPLPNSAIAMFRGKPVYAFYVKTHGSYTPVDELRRYQFKAKLPEGKPPTSENVEPIGDESNPKDKKRIAMLQWLKKRLDVGWIFKKAEHPTKDDYEPIVLGHTMPVLEKREDGKYAVFSVWAMVPSISFDERVAYVEGKRVLNNMFASREWLKQLLPMVSIIVTILLVVIVFWQISNVAHEFHDVAMNFGQVAKQLDHIARLLATSAGSGG